MTRNEPRPVWSSPERHHEAGRRISEYHHESAWKVGVLGDFAFLRSDGHGVESVVFSIPAIIGTVICDIHHRHNATR